MTALNNIPVLNKTLLSDDVDVSGGIAALACAVVSSDIDAAGDICIAGGIVVEKGSDVKDDTVAAGSFAVLAEGSTVVSEGLVLTGSFVVADVALAADGVAVPSKMSFGGV